MKKSEIKKLQIKEKLPFYDSKKMLVEMGLMLNDEGVLTYYFLGSIAFAPAVFASEYGPLMELISEKANVILKNISTGRIC